MSGGILSILAHPDDFEIFLGGTAILARRAGREVRSVVVTDGAAGHPSLPPDKLAEIRRGEATAAAGRIGARASFLGHHDGRLRATEELREQLVRVIREAAPAVLLTHPPNDYHPDHRNLSAEVCAAAVLSHHAGSGVAQAELVFLDTFGGLGFEPEFYVDISSALDEKLALLACHASQTEAFKLRGSDLLERVRLQSAFRGMQCGAAAAEGFTRWKAVGSIRAGGPPLP